MTRSIAIVGTGALGSALGCALHARGYEVSAWNRGGGPGDSTSEPFVRRATLAELAPSGSVPDVLVLCVTDTALEGVARRCAAELPNVPPVVLHTSGCTPVEALDALAIGGACTGLLHPLAAIDGRVSSAASTRFEETAFGVLGGPLALRVATALACGLGGRALAVRTSGQARYHAAATLAAGGTVVLAEVARALLVGALAVEAKGQASDATDVGEDLEGDALFAVRSLVTSAALNLSRTTPAAALTGPAVRGDLNTIAAHRDALAANDPAAVEARRSAEALAPALLRLVAERTASARAAGGAANASDVDLEALARALGLRG